MTYMPPTLFGAGKSIVSWFVVDADGDAKNDCVMVDDQSHRLILLSNSANPPRGESVEYCVGSLPRGLAIGDFDGNGRDDIGVVNAGSATLSVLFNRGGGRFSGQQSFSLTENPTYVSMVSSLPDEPRALVVSHPIEDRVSILNLSADLRRSDAFSVPTGSDPFVVSAWNDTSRLKFLVRHRNMKTKSLLLSWFEQINTRQFVERSFRPTPATRIIALNAVEGIRPGVYDFYYATNDQQTKQTTVWLGVSEEGRDFKASKQLFSFADSAASTSFVMSGYLNSDAFQDVVVALGSPRNELAVWYGGAPSATRDSIEWIRNVQPVSDDAVIMKDVNADGRMDIVMLDAIRHAVIVSYGPERRGFKQPVLVAPAEDVHSIRVAALRENAVADIVLSNPSRGTVSIIANPFSRSGDR
jgi:hypothetical protein